MRERTREKGGKKESVKKGGKKEKREKRRNSVKDWIDRLGKCKRWSDSTREGFSLTNLAEFCFYQNIWVVDACVAPSQLTTKDK